MSSRASSALRLCCVALAVGLAPRAYPDGMPAANVVNTMRMYGAVASGLSFAFPANVRTSRT